jgi:hypothetical protein
MRTALATCVVLLAAPFGVAGGQGSFTDRPAATAAGASSEALSDLLSPGTRLRIIAPRMARDRIVGIVRAVHRDTVILDTADVAREQRRFFPSTVLVEEYRQMSLPLAEVGSVERSRGRSRAIGALKGGLRGALIAGVLSGLGSLSAGSRDGITLRDFTRGASEGMIVGVAIGAPWGWASGAEQWQPVKIPRRKTARDVLASQP